MKIGAGLAVGIVVILGVVAGASFYFLSQQNGNPTTSTPTTTTSSGAAPSLRSEFDTHLANIDSRNIPTLLLDYLDHAVVTWTGSAAGLGGFYNGTNNIRLLYAAALSTAQTITVTPQDFLQINNSATQVTVNATLGITGKSSVLGPFNGTVKAQIVYVNSGGAWQISKENWNYLVFNVTASGGATTFPEWQKIGPVNPSMRSTDWLHNFVWDYGGFGVALMVYVYIVALLGLVVLRRRRQ